MPIIYRKGNAIDVFEKEHNVLLNIRSCAPIANIRMNRKLISNYPILLHEDKKSINNKVKLGDILLIKCPNTEYVLHRYIINTYAQNDIIKGDDMINFDALNTCLIKIYSYCNSNEYSLCMPKLSIYSDIVWNKIESHIERIFNNLYMYVYYE